VDGVENDGDEFILDASNSPYVRAVTAVAAVVVIIVVEMVSETRYCHEWPDAWWAVRLGNNRTMEDEGCLRRVQHRLESRGQFLGVYV